MCVCQLFSRPAHIHPLQILSDQNNTLSELLHSVAADPSLDAVPAPADVAAKDGAVPVESVQVPATVAVDPAHGPAGAAAGVGGEPDGSLKFWRSDRVWVGPAYLACAAAALGVCIKVVIRSTAQLGVVEEMAGMQFPGPSDSARTCFLLFSHGSPSADKNSEYTLSTINTIRQCGTFLSYRPSRRRRRCPRMTNTL